MSNPFLLNTNSFFLISFLFSLLCHLFFFSSFIVVLPLRPQALNPDIVFLGPILEEYDIEWFSAIGEEFLPLVFSSQWQKNTKEQILLPHAVLNKPLANLVKSAQAKTTLKGSFLEETNQAPDTDIDLETTLPSYRPLRYSQ